jgi:hypothetical protein
MPVNMDAIAWLESLPPERLRALAANLAVSLERDGLTVFRATDERFLPIPPVLSPRAVPRACMAELSRDAHLLLRAVAKLAAWTVGEGSVWGRRLYRGFTPIEKAILNQAPRWLSEVATARVDYFIDPAGRARALELNATIPAMQGYSDLIAHGWVRAVAHERGLSAAATQRLVAATGSNTAELLASVLAHYRARGGRAQCPSILVVSRRGDAQLGELLYYERRWREGGHRVQHVWVDEVDIDSNGRVTARGETWDLVYRHIFARRVETGSTFARLLVEPPPGVVIINPVLSPLEVKGLLALLHQALDDEAQLRALGLDGDERDAVGRVVPWTRLLLPGPATVADGTHVADLPAYASDHPTDLVLKRSWDYGGKSVVLGPEVEAEATRARMREATGADTWTDFVAAAARQDDVWVVQEFVPPAPQRHLLIERRADGGIDTRWGDLFVDLNAYCNLGDAPRPTGGACRASGSRIVNILGGGGLTPLVPAEVVDDLLA